MIRSKTKYLYGIYTPSKKFVFQDENMKSKTNGKMQLISEK